MKQTINIDGEDYNLFITIGQPNINFKKLVYFEGYFYKKKDIIETRQYEITAKVEILNQIEEILNKSKL